MGRLISDDRLIPPDRLVPTGDLVDTGARLVTREEFDRLNGPVRTYKIGEIEWCPNQRNMSKSKPIVNIRAKGITIARAAWLLAGQPERVKLGWDGAGRRIVIAPDREGQFRVSGGNRTIKIGGPGTAAWLAERGVKQGKCPAKWDAVKGMLVVEIGSEREAPVVREGRGSA